MRDPRLDTDPDFIASPKHENSLKQFLKDYPDGAPNTVISRVMKMTEKEVEEIYIRAILKLKRVVNPNE